MDKIDFILFGLLFGTAISLIPLAGIDIMQKKMGSNEYIYIKGNFDFYKAKDPADRNSKALYWYIRKVDYERNRRID